MKTCPYCAEEIKDTAIRCRWCLTWLVEEIPAGAETMPMRAAESAPVSAMAEPEMAEHEMAKPEMAKPEMAKPEMAKPEPVPVTTEPEPAATMEQPAAEEPAGAVATEPVATEPMAAAEAAPAQEAAPAAEAKIEFTHTGTRYLLGYGGDYFGIWDRNAPQQAVERFPRSDEGWASAWARYSAIETNWMDLRTGQKSG